MKNDGHFPDLDGRAHSLKNLIRLNTSYTCNLPCADYILVEKVQKEKKKRIFIAILPLKAKFYALEIAINST